MSGRMSERLFLLVLSSCVLLTNCKDHFRGPVKDYSLGECRWKAVFTGDLLRRHEEVGDVGTCELLCRQESECRAYTYIRRLRSNPGSCFTRGKGHGPITGFHQTLVVKSGVVSGIVDCKTPDSCLKDGVSFSKGFIKELDPIRSILSCRTACITHNDCALYSFFPDEQTCVLRDKSASVNRKENHYKVKVVSGILNCPAPEESGTDDNDEVTDDENETGDAVNGYDDEEIDVDESVLENEKEVVGRRRLQNEVRGAAADQIKKRIRGCTGRIPGNIRITDMPIPVGTEAVSYCVDDIRKNTVIRCIRVRRLRAWELPDCKSSLLKNTGYCEVYPPSEVITLPNSTLIPVGGAVVAMCHDQTVNPTILSCLPDKPILDSDFPSC